MAFGTVKCEVGIKYTAVNPIALIKQMFSEMWMQRISMFKERSVVIVCIIKSAFDGKETSTELAYKLHSM